ncbi:hypothetical protein [Mesorhizobium japonicum]|nr:hypothetical protein [Mesorhizobium japonicum]
MATASAILAGNILRFCVFPQRSNPVRGSDRVPFNPWTLDLPNRWGDLGHHKRPPMDTSSIVGRGEGIEADLDYLDVRTAEQGEAEKADALLAELAATPAQSLAGVVAKLAVILREASDNTDLCEFPLPHLRSALADLHRLTHEAASDQPAWWPAGDQSIGSLFEQPASSFAAWRAFSAWSQGDEGAYRAWADTFKHCKARANRQRTLLGRSSLERSC